MLDLSSNFWLRLINMKFISSSCFVVQPKIIIQWLLKFDKKGFWLVKVSSYKATNSHLINDDDNKPQSWKISKDNQGDRFFISWSTRLNGNREELERVIDWLVEKTTIRLQSKSIPIYRLLCEVILLNLSKSLLQRRWVQIPKSSSAYAKGTVTTCQAN